MITVVIPTHNPHAGRLQRTLRALRAQTLPAGQWECLVVDNASVPALQAADWQSSAPANLRVVAEPSPGLSHARRRGFLEGRGEFFVLVDDDNELAPDYLAEVLRLFAAHTKVGALGGRSLPEFEQPPAPWTREFDGLIACRDLGDTPLVSAGLRHPATGKNDYPGFAPIGAGMALRRAAAQAWLDRSNAAALPDRQGASLSSSGDNDIVLSVMAAGWEAAYFPSLRLTHLIPPVRTTRDYLGRLNRGIQNSWMRVLSRHDANPWSPLSTWTVPLRQAKAWFTHRAWSSPAAWVRWQGACGHFEGRAGVLTAQPAAPRNDWIDLLRVLSAVAVVLFHFAVMPVELPPGRLAQLWHGFWQYGHLGVPVFFALSGYYLVPGWLRASTPAPFLQRRLWRLLPPYWCSLALMLGIALVVKLLTGVNDVARLSPNPLEWLAVLLLLTSPVTSVASLNWVAWTLLPLLVYSFLFGALLLLPGRRRIPVMAAIHVALCAADTVFHPAGGDWLLLLKCWPMVGVGVALALWSQHRRAGTVMLSASVLHVLVTTPFGWDEAHYAVISLLTVVALAVTAGRPAPAWIGRIAALGPVTYSLYLIHVPVGIYVIHRLLPVAPANAAVLVLGHLAALAGCVLVALPFHRFCEKPFVSRA